MKSMGPSRVVPNSCTLLSGGKASQTHWIGGGGDTETELLTGPTHTTRDMMRRFQHLTPGDNMLWSHKDGDELFEHILRTGAQSRDRVHLTLIGRSWGAGTAIRVTNRLREHGIIVDQLITLDAVGREKLESDNHREWTNVYQRQSSLDRVVDGMHRIPILGFFAVLTLWPILSLRTLILRAGSLADNAATVGNQFGHQENATRNVEVTNDHGDAEGMFSAAVCMPLGDDGDGPASAFSTPSELGRLSD
jgi:pimeloyl-ACP methyl ester carboxylesterase